MLKMKAEGIKKLVYNLVWPKLSYLKLKIILSMPNNRACLISIKNQLSANSFDNQQCRINFIRNWVNTNSVHLIDEEHDSYAFNVAEVLNRLNNYALGKGAKPHLSCGPRAYAMKAILDFMSIQSRIIDLFGLTEQDDKSIKVSPHTLIEVMITDADKWELHDPDFNVAYANAITKVYLAAEDMLHLDETQRGFHASEYQIENPINLKNTIDRLFEWCILYRYSYEGKSSVLLHKSELNLNQTINSSHESLASYISQRAFDFKSVVL